jgi:hypothetical protein
MDAHGVVALLNEQPLAMTGATPAGKIVFIETGVTAFGELADDFVVFDAVLDRAVHVFNEVRRQLRNFSRRLPRELKVDFHK